MTTSEPSDDGFTDDVVVIVEAMATHPAGTELDADGHPIPADPAE